MVLGPIGLYFTAFVHLWIWIVRILYVNSYCIYWLKCILNLCYMFYRVSSVNGSTIKWLLKLKLQFVVRDSRLQQWRQGWDGVSTTGNYHQDLRLRSGFASKESKTSETLLNQHNIIVLYACLDYYHWTACSMLKTDDLIFLRHFMLENFTCRLFKVDCIMYVSTPACSAVRD